MTMQLKIAQAISLRKLQITKDTLKFALLHCAIHLRETMTIQ
jgi:hypothetical protein